MRNQQTGKRTATVHEYIARGGSELFGDISRIEELVLPSDVNNFLALKWTLLGVFGVGTSERPGDPSLCHEIVYVVGWKMSGEPEYPQEFSERHTPL